RRGQAQISPRLKSVVRSVPTVVPELGQDRIRLRRHDRGVRVGKIGTKAIFNRMQDILPDREITSGSGSFESTGHFVTEGNLKTRAFRRLARSHVNGLVPKVPLCDAARQCPKSETTARLRWSRAIVSSRATTR